MRSDIKGDCFKKIASKLKKEQRRSVICEELERKQIKEEEGRKETAKGAIKGRRSMTLE
jgi:hypothetical protein